MDEIDLRDQLLSQMEAERRSDMAGRQQLKRMTRRYELLMAQVVTPGDTSVQVTLV